MSDYRDCEEDGMGFSGLVPTLRERREEQTTARLEAQLAAATARAEKAEKEREHESLRLAACGVAALQNTKETITARITTDNEYYSASYQDVCNAVDREIGLRERLTAATTLLGRANVMLSSIDAEWCEDYRAYKNGEQP